MDDYVEILSTDKCKIPKDQCSQIADQEIAAEAHLSSNESSFEIRNGSGLAESEGCVSSPECVLPARFANLGRLPTIVIGDGIAPQLDMPEQCKNNDSVKWSHPANAELGAKPSHAETSTANLLQEAAKEKPVSTSKHKVAYTDLSEPSQSASVKLTVKSPPTQTKSKIAGTISHSVSMESIVKSPPPSGMCHTEKAKSLKDGKQLSPHH